MRILGLITRNWNVLLNEKIEWMWFEKTFDCCKSQDNYSPVISQSAH